MTLYTVLIYAIKDDDNYEYVGTMKNLAEFQVEWLRWRLHSDGYYVESTATRIIDEAEGRKLLGLSPVERIEDPSNDYEYRRETIIFEDRFNVSGYEIKCLLDYDESRCGHSYDCCGCWTQYKPTIKREGRKLTIIRHGGRNL